ncbi:MAG: NUDIX domain-containing protein [Pseudomonadota bacterium]
MMRRIGETWREGKPYRDRPGVYAIIAGRLGDGRTGMLCVDQEGEIQLPGGGIDPGEQPLAALHREVWEETGWRIAEPRRFCSFQRFAWLPDYLYWARKTQTIYLARAVQRMGPPQEPGHSPHWLTPQSAAGLLSVAGDRWALGLAMARGLI